MSYSMPKVRKSVPLRIAFVHPDLGIGKCENSLNPNLALRSPQNLGGAERLVVDAAVGLQNLGHKVEIFTSHHDTSRCFEETRDGTLSVHVLGNSIVPPNIKGRFSIVCAILRQLHLSIALLLSFTLYYLYRLPLISSFIVPPETPFKSSQDWSPFRSVKPFDVFFVDQLSASIPLLRWGSRTRTVFYCHFPDLLLSPGRNGGGAGGALKQLYRAPIDFVEELTTGRADKILVNSQFTADVFCRTFKALNRIPRVVYPGIDAKSYLAEPEAKDEKTRKEIEALSSETKTLLSINRFERKKDVGLALESFSKLPDLKGLRLVIAGGYDPRLPDNVSTLEDLQELVRSIGLTQYTYSPNPPSGSGGPSISSEPPPKGEHEPQVLFIPNLSNSQKLFLLKSPSTVALLYTPSNEHLGIVPLEAMACGVPVLATASGGPLETVVDAGIPTSDVDLANVGTGLVRKSDVQEWTEALSSLVGLQPTQRASISDAGKRRVNEKFSIDVMSKEVDKALRDALEIKAGMYSEVELWQLVMVSVFPLVVMMPLFFLWLGGGYQF